MGILRLWINHSQWCICTIVCFLITITSVNAIGYALDIRKLQYPVSDAEESHASGFPKFAAYIQHDKPRIPGVTNDHKRIIRDKFQVNILNEYRLYDQSEVDPEEQYMLERYCTRYNRRMLQLLGM